MTISDSNINLEDKEEARIITKYYDSNGDPKVNCEATISCKLCGFKAPSSTFPDNHRCCEEAFKRIEKLEKEVKILKRLANIFSKKEIRDE